MSNEQSHKSLKLATLALDDCLLLYEQHLRTSSPNQAQIDLAQLSTAIDRFTLPGWGFTPFKGDRPTQAE
ncbi:MAG: hypothetical protein LH702_16665 [Phormidesmis sp. CAN_BIN44]|nr:hypothetical protein [Phormidesmis sp. CAN_BIN44]